MNRLIRIMSFVLPIFCLLISVSYADITTDTNYNTIYDNGWISVNPDDDVVLLNYTYRQVSGILYNYYKNNITEPFEILVSELKADNKDCVFYSDLNDSYYLAVKDKSSTFVRVPESDDYTYLGIYGDAGSTFSVYVGGNSGYYTYYKCSPTTSTAPVSYIRFESANIRNVIFSNTSVLNMIKSGSVVTWDGTYFYESTTPDEPEPETPSLPSNAEIAQVVQAFYNSDYYKNNKDFSDFMVLYNTTNGNVSFIGHILGNTLGQVIIPPNYRYQGKLYNEQWWKFYIDENQGATPYGTSYHLYSTNILTLDVISDDGIGKISELVNLDFSSKSVIIYSTTDYPVRTYVLDETTGDYTYTDGTIEGDQYTYDEELDPTQSGYNPLENFVTVNPSDTIVNNADFGDLSDSFEEHKSIFSFTENMQWLILANNKLSNYFLGFIVMCALFITLGRVLKG